MDERTTTPAASICILASGSAGNCSVLLLGGRNGSGPQVVLIDAGLSPRRTRRHLEGMNLGLDCVRAIVVTHFDHDHWHGGWRKGLPDHVGVWAHKRHAARGRRSGIAAGRFCGFDNGFDVLPGLHASSVLASHDELGVAAFRFELRSAGLEHDAPAATLGFATDVGRMRYELVEHLRGVDVLAIESNYCPQMQAASARPWFLKRRIMGGSGHLSNDEALAAVRMIEPASHVILLHLSRECNDPALVAGLHDGAPYRCTITCQCTPTEWVHITPSRRASALPPPEAQLPLFGCGPVPVDAQHAGGR
jgi:phosphoribosyl 1,2-cyclic phosphodiesterase